MYFILTDNIPITLFCQNFGYLISKLQKIDILNIFRRIIENKMLFQLYRFCYYNQLTMNA